MSLIPFEVKWLLQQNTLSLQNVRQPCLINLAILNNGKPTSFSYIDNTTTSAKSLFSWSVVHCLCTKGGPTSRWNGVVKKRRGI